MSDEPVKRGVGEEAAEAADDPWKSVYVDVTDGDADQKLTTALGRLYDHYGSENVKIGSNDPVADPATGQLRIYLWVNTDRSSS